MRWTSCAEVSSLKKLPHMLICRAASQISPRSCRNCSCRSQETSWSGNTHSADGCRASLPARSPIGRCGSLMRCRSSSNKKERSFLLFNLALHESRIKSCPQCKWSFRCALSAGATFGWTWKTRANAKRAPFGHIISAECAQCRIRTSVPLVALKDR